MDRVIDASGLQCIQLLMGLRSEPLGLRAGTLVQVISTDPVSVLDLPAWCHLIGHAHLKVVQDEATFMHLVQIADQPTSTRTNASWRT